MKHTVEYSIILLIVLFGGWLALHSVAITLVIQRNGKSNSIPAPIPTSGMSVEPLPTPAPLPSVAVPREIVRGDKAKRQVIFTFDGGAGSQSAQLILATLARHQVKASFFLTGMFASKNPELVKQIASQGHEIFNHTYTHPHLPTLSDEQIASELNKTDETIKNLTGKSTKPYFRPPYGDRNARVLQLAAGQGYQSVFWTTDAMDWRESEGFQAQESKDRIVSNIKPGEIYLMHIGDAITGKILDEVMNVIEAKGYQIVSLSQGIYYFGLEKR